MLFEIKNAKLVEVTSVTSGTSKSGNAWTKATAIVEKREGTYTDSYPLLVFGDKIQEAQALVGAEVDVKFSVQSRKYGERWYTDICLRSIAANVEETAREQTPEPQKEDNPDGDLPF